MAQFRRTRGATAPDYTQPTAFLVGAEDYTQREDEPWQIVRAIKAMA